MKKFKLLSLVGIVSIALATRRIGSWPRRWRRRPRWWWGGFHGGGFGGGGFHAGGFHGGGFRGGAFHGGGGFRGGRFGGGSFHGGGFRGDRNWLAPSRILQ